MKSIGRVFVLLSSLILLTVATGCGDATTSNPVGPTTTSQAPPTVNATFRWVNPIDELKSSDATFIRAYAESFAALVDTGQGTAVYPGFPQADRVGIDLDDPHESDKEIENEYLKILSVTTLENGTEQAFLCDGAIPRKLTFVREGAAPPRNQAGNNRRPKENVFGDWYATEWVMPGNGPSPVHHACNQLLQAHSGSRHEPLPPLPGWPGSAP